MKFTIVTPTYNSENYLSETMQSVVSQKGDFSIEYIVVDNNSGDNTLAIVKQYQQLIKNRDYVIHCNGVEIRYYQEADGSMYEAINKGFQKASGDIYAWINSDDIYLPGAFNVVAQSFKQYPEMKWLKGITSYINEHSSIYEIGRCLMYDRDWLRNGVYGRDSYFIQQDSVFWHAHLWKTAGGLDTSFKRAGDYSLWIKFSRCAHLYSVKAYISCFRKVEGQLSQDIASYRKECERISDSANSLSIYLRNKIKLFFWFIDKAHFPFLHKIIYRSIFTKQRLLLIDIIAGEKPVLKTISHYVAD